MASIMELAAQYAAEHPELADTVEHEATLTARFYPDTHPDIVLVCSCGETIVLGENATPTHAVETLAAHIAAATS